MGGASPREPDAPLDPLLPLKQETLFAEAHAESDLDDTETGCLLPLAKWCADGASSAQDRVGTPRTCILAGGPSSLAPASERAEPTLAAKLQAWLLPVVLSTPFQVAMGVAIVGSVVLQCTTSHVRLVEYIDEKPVSDTLSVHVLAAAGPLRLLFFAIFTGELVVRLLAEQRQFFCGSGRWWNLFDAGCWASMALSVVKQLLASEHRSVFWQVVRALRLLRVARAVRLIRYLHPLRLMIISIISCLPLMMWALVLVILFSSMFALYLEDHALSYIHKNNGLEGLPKDLKENLQTNWGGMPQALRTLVYCFSGAKSWADVSAPFWYIHPLSGVLFGVFMLVTMFGILNVLIGVFVQEASNIAELDRDLMIDKAVEDHKSNVSSIGTFFDSLDEDNTGEVLLERLHAALKDDRVAGNFHLWGVDQRKAKVMFDLMDDDQNGLISKNEFVQGFLRLHGNSSAADVALNLVQNKAISNKLDEISEMIKVGR